MDIESRYVSVNLIMVNRFFFYQPSRPLMAFNSYEILPEISKYWKLTAFFWTRGFWREPNCSKKWEQLLYP